MAEEKSINPIEKACSDAFVADSSGRHFDLNNFSTICTRRGLVGDYWSSKTLSMPLRLFEKESKDMSEEEIDVLLEEFAEAIDFDANLIKRHFYAIRLNHEVQFLAERERQEKKQKAFEEFIEDAEHEVAKPVTIKTTKPEPTSEEKEEETWICDQCGAENPIDAEECQSCGEENW